MQKKKLFAFLSSCLILSAVCLPMQTVHASNIDSDDAYGDYYIGESEDTYYDDGTALTSDDYEDTSVYDESEGDSNAQILDDDYYIDKYHIDIDVGEDNTFHITETLTYNFVQAHYGMTREIPLNHTRYRENGSQDSINATISNVKCSDTIASKEEDDDEYIIKVGNANNYIRGEKTYTLSYDYALGKDPLDDADELYFNIVGTEWDCPINNISWSIHMPKDFDEKTIGYSVGSNGTNGYDTSLLTYEVKDNTITGEYKTYLRTYEGITIRATLPEGYFIYRIDLTPYIILLVIIILTGILFWFTGKDNPAIEVVSFEPPEGYSSLDVAYVMKEGITSTDFCTLLITLADQGYISIKQNKKDSFSITKIKDYNGDDVVAENYMNGMFKKKDTVSNKSLARDHFYETVEDSIVMEKDKINERNLFYNNKIPTIIYAIADLIIGIEMYILTKNITTGVAICVIGFLLSTVINAIIQKNKDFTSALIISIMGIVGLFLVNITSPHHFFELLAGIIAVTIVSVFWNFGQKKTEEGNKIYGQLLGFKSFIEKAEVDRLKMFVEEDPEYYYHILPYAYAFDLSDKWIKNFEELNLEIPEPDWYSGYDTFNPTGFYVCFHDAMEHASASKAPESSSSSDGSGFSGGGFSGGGSGGGGGGAW